MRRSTVGVIVLAVCLREWTERWVIGFQAQKYTHPIVSGAAGCSERRGVWNQAKGKFMFFLPALSSFPVLRCCLLSWLFQDGGKCPLLPTIFIFYRRCFSAFRAKLGQCSLGWCCCFKLRFGASAYRTVPTEARVCKVYGSKCVSMCVCGTHSLEVSLGKSWSRRLLWRCSMWEEETFNQQECRIFASQTNIKCLLLEHDELD